MTTRNFSWLGGLLPLLGLASVSVVAVAGGPPLSREADATDRGAFVTTDAGSHALPTDVLVAAPGLYPGAKGNVTVVINNRGTSAVRVTDITGDGAATPDEAHAAGCTTTGVSFSDQSGLGIDVPASGSSTSTLLNAVSMSNASSDGCQGAVFSVPVSVLGITK